MNSNGIFKSTKDERNHKIKALELEILRKDKALAVIMQGFLLLMIGNLPRWQRVAIVD